MTLRELGEEYIVCADELKLKEKTLSKKLGQYSGIRYYEVCRDIKIIQDMERDLRTTGLFLKDYYTNKADSRVYHAGR